MATRGIQCTSEHPFEDERIAVSAEEAARLLDVSSRTIKRLPLVRKKIGRLTRYPLNALRDYVERAPSA